LLRVFVHAVHVIVIDVAKFDALLQDDSLITDLAAALTKQGISVFRFDFSGNG
jgi:hypothetical protein